MLSFGMLRSVALVRTDVSDEHTASIIMTKRIGKLGTTLAVTGNRSTLGRSRLPISVSLMKGAICSSESSVTRCHMQEDDILHSHCKKNLKSHK
jgi:hypothetical protein